MNILKYQLFRIWTRRDKFLLLFGLALLAAVISGGATSQFSIEDGNVRLVLGTIYGSASGFLVPGVVCGVFVKEYLSEPGIYPVRSAGFGRKDVLLATGILTLLLTFGILLFSRLVLVGISVSAYSAVVPQMSLSQWARLIFLRLYLLLGNGFLFFLFTAYCPTWEPPLIAGCGLTALSAMRPTHILLRCFPTGGLLSQVPIWYVLGTTGLFLVGFLLLAFLPPNMKA